MDADKTENKIESSPKRLRIIDCCNDYLAIWILPDAGGIELPEDAKGKYKNQGVVIGVGPDANKSQNYDYRNTKHEIKLGDEMVIRGNTFTRITPGHGPYADQVIMMVHKPDLIYRHAHHGEDKYLFVEQWTAEDTEQTREAIANKS